MQIELNGQPREVAEGTTVGDLLVDLGLKRDGIAVAVHMRVIPRGEHARTALQPGDKVEIIQAVGGG